MRTILSILLFAIWTAALFSQAPPPRQAVKGTTNESRDIKKKAPSEQTETNDTGTATDPIKPRDDQEHGGGKSEEVGKPVVVERFNVIEQRGGGYDWIFNLLLVIVGAGQIFVVQKTLRQVERQANAAIRSADHAEMATKRTQRADVLLDGVGINGMGPQVLPGKLEIMLKNFGPTRATNVEADCRLIYDGVPDGNHASLKLAALAATQEEMISFEPFNKFMTRPTWDAIKMGKSPLRFVVNLAYTDVFETTYKDAISGTYLPQTDAWRIDQTMQSSSEIKNKSD